MTGWGGGVTFCVCSCGLLVPVNWLAGSVTQPYCAVSSSTSARTSLPYTVPFASTVPSRLTLAGTPTAAASRAIVAAYCSSSPMISLPSRKEVSRPEPCPAVITLCAPPPLLYLPLSRRYAASARTLPMGVNAVAECTWANAWTAAGIRRDGSGVPSGLAAASPEAAGEATAAALTVYRSPAGTPSGMIPVVVATLKRSAAAVCGPAVPGKVNPVVSARSGSHGWS